MSYSSAFDLFRAQPADVADRQLCIALAWRQIKILRTVRHTGLHGLTAGFKDDKMAEFQPHDLIR